MTYEKVDTSGPIAWQRIITPGNRETRVQSVSDYCVTIRHPEPNIDWNDLALELATKMNDGIIDMLADNADFLPRLVPSFPTRGTTV